MAQPLDVPELIENQIAARTRRIHDQRRVDRRTRNRSDIAVSPARIAHIVHAKNEIQIRKEPERIGHMEFEARIGMPAR